MENANLTSLKNKIETYNEINSQLGTNEGDVGCQVLKGIKYDIDYLIKQLKAEGINVCLNKPSRGCWGISKID